MSWLFFCLLEALGGARLTVILITCHTLPLAHIPIQTTVIDSQPFLFLPWLGKIAGNASTLIGLSCFEELFSDKSKILAFYQNMLHSVKAGRKYGKTVGLPFYTGNCAISIRDSFRVSFTHSLIIIDYCLRWIFLAPLHKISFRFKRHNYLFAF